MLFSLAVNPATGRVYVANTEARNEVRFEGTGAFAGSTVRGHVVENRITVLDAAGARPIHLHPHIRYDVTPGTRVERASSLAQPGAMAVTSDGTTMYLAAFSSGKVQRIPVAVLESGTFRPNAGEAIPIPGGGPSGLALDETRGWLHVLSRFDNAVTTVRLADRAAGGGLG